MNKVLIIDDDKELCTLIKRSVLSENIEADICNTGKEGLKKLKERISACNIGRYDARHGRVLNTGTNQKRKQFTDFNVYL